MLVFEQAMMDGKLATFCNSAGGIKQGSFWQMVVAFHELLEQGSSRDLPDVLTWVDLLDWYLRLK